MTRTRDEFSPRTKSDLALRASYVCSFCKKSTVGPSDEGSGAVTMIGVAAHISAAAAGPGSRRYISEMTAKERSNIDNGIWLCASCSVLIDRDEEHFTVEYLHQIKRDHEISRRIGGESSNDAGDIIAIGRDIIAVGSMIRSGPESTRVRLSHFVSGSGRDLWSLSRDFSRWPPDERYVLLNELGFGGLLVEPPSIDRLEYAYEVEFKLKDPAPHRNATASISIISREDGRMIRGIEAYVQNFETVLGMSIGTWFLDLRSGSNLSDLYWRYKGSPWFERLAMIEMIRLSLIPHLREGQGGTSTPFGAVSRVNCVEVPTFDLIDQKLAVGVRFDLEGMGQWESTLSVFISTPEQLVTDRENARRRQNKIGEIERQYRKPE